MGKADYGFAASNAVVHSLDEAKQKMPFLIFYDNGQGCFS